MNKQCEGWRRYGGVFTLGPVRWEQCKNTAVVILTVTQDGETKDFPACGKCWNECLERGMAVGKAVPVTN